MPQLKDIMFTRRHMEEACKELKPASSPGPDGFPSVLLKVAKKELSKPLSLLLRASLDQGKIPPDLLLVQVSPIHKGGSRALPANYRPVALTSHVMKLFERVIRKFLVTHLEENNMLPEGQHGFRAQRSCLTQLLNFWDSILENMEAGRGVDAVYTDFSKAFDKCETGVLLHRLKECGITGKMGVWLAAFLDPEVRKQAVGVDGSLSNLVNVLSGVPQGTVLGPCLFLVHLLGISSVTSEDTWVSSFADDTRLLRGIEAEEDCQALQLDLSRVYGWAEEIGMVFNAKKFEVLRFWSKPESAPAFEYLAPDNTPIEVKDHLRDLGVKVSCDLSFKEQIESVILSATQMAGWALRTFKRRSSYLMLVVLRSLIQPRLDYCSQLWSPRDQGSINKIEKVQRDFVRQIKEPFLDGLNYWEKLEKLGLSSQERRRERHQICMIWKISQGLISGYKMNWSFSERRGRMAVPQPIKPNAPAKVKRARESSFAVHAARIFNLLPIHLRNEDCGDFDLFKNHLDIYLSQVPDQPTTQGLARQALTNSLLDQIPLCDIL